LQPLLWLVVQTLCVLSINLVLSRDALWRLVTLCGIPTFWQGGHSKIGIEVEMGPDAEDTRGNKSRVRITVRVSELIKFNINAAIRDRQMKERAFVEHVDDAVRIYATLHPMKPQFTDLLDLEEMKKDSDPNKWGQKAIGARIGREQATVWRILNSVENDGNAQVDVLELLLIAADLQVPISYLLFPTREQIEANAILIFEEFTPPLEVSANQWLAWVSGLSALPGKDSALQANNALSLSTAHMASWDIGTRDAPRAKAMDKLNIEDTQRINEGLLSASAPFLDALRTSTFRNPDNTYPSAQPAIDEKITDHQLAINRSRSLQDLLFHLREAVLIAGDQNRQDAKNAIIEVSDKLRADIACLFLAYDVDAPIPVVPFTKEAIAEQLRIITIMLAHAKLAEIEHQGFQAERLPASVRLEREPFKMERDIPEYLDGAFDNRQNIENQQKMAEKNQKKEIK